MDVFLDALFNILAIFGIIIGGGFLLYFIGSGILSLVNSADKEETKNSIENKSE